MSVVESRYAEALLSCTASPGEADDIGSRLQSFSDSMEDEELRVFLLSPAISAAIKKETVAKLLPPNSPKTVVSFLSLLIDKGRLSFLPGILTQYEARKDKLWNTLPIVVHSAQALGQEQLDEIKATYMQKYGAIAATVQNKLDPSLLGGICVQIGDIRVDDTLQGRLRGLHAYVMDRL